MIDGFDNAYNGRVAREIIRSRCGNVNFTLPIFAYKMSYSGDVAQLGERRVRNAKVGSSILLCSIFFIIETPEGTLLISDDTNGVIYRVTYQPKIMSKLNVRH